MIFHSLCWNRLCNQYPHLRYRWRIRSHSRAFSRQQLPSTSNVSGKYLLKNERITSIHAELNHVPHSPDRGSLAQITAYATVPFYSEPHGIGVVNRRRTQLTSFSSARKESRWYCGRNYWKHQPASQSKWTNSPRTLRESMDVLGAD